MPTFIWKFSTITNRGQKFILTIKQDAETIIYAKDLVINKILNTSRYGIKVLY